MTYDQVADELIKANPSVVRSQMFGMPVLKVGKKALAGDWHGDMVFKLAAASPAHTEALDIAGAELFDPGMGKPMKEWVVVPAASADRWDELAQAAFDYVETLTK